MGRLTLNMLMSFAEFERETIAERTRDKIAGARRKGKWTGGPVPLGYTVVDKKLVVDDLEAVVVREIAFASCICRGLLHSGPNRRGLATRMQAHRAREVATFRRLRCRGTPSRAVRPRVPRSPSSR